jgi:hypothetical protein
MSDDELGRQQVQIRDLGHANTLSEAQPIDIPVSKNGKEQVTVSALQISCCRACSHVVPKVCHRVGKAWFALNHNP